MTQTLPTLASLIADSPTLRLRSAVAETLRARLPFLAVETMAGKLDVADVVAKKLVRAPGLMIAATRVGPREPAVGGRDEAIVELSVYVVAEDTVEVVGGIKRRLDRDQVGYAILDGLISLLLDDGFARWGLDDIGAPEDVEAQPFLALRAMLEGVAFYVVTWRQALILSRPMPEIAWNGSPP
mgnify:FL=1